MLFLSLVLAANVAIYHRVEADAAEAASADNRVLTKAEAARTEPRRGSTANPGLNLSTGLGQEGLPAVKARLGRMNKLMSGPTSPVQEQKILHELAAASPVELNVVLANIDLHKLLDDVDDHLFGPDNRAALLGLLCETRLHEIAPGNRASLIYALQVGATGWQKEQAIGAVLLGSFGPELSAVKNALDQGAIARHDHYDLGQLIYRDIDDAGLRRKLLKHFAQAAAPSAELKILSDIDDTFYANLNDERYPKTTVYPGVLAFYHALDVGPQDAGLGPDMIMLTARPNDRPGFVEDYSSRSLADKGLKAVIMGVDVDTVLDTAYLLDNDNMAEKKQQNFGRVRALYPENNVVFIGDSGQGDLTAGEQMLSQDPGAVRGVFIHDVIGQYDAAARQKMAKKNLFVVDNYVDAAIIAQAQGLISAGSLLQVAERAAKDLQGIKFSPEQQETRRQLEASIAKVREAPLPSELVSSPVDND